MYKCCESCKESLKGYKTENNKISIFCARFKKVVSKIKETSCEEFCPQVTTNDLREDWFDDLKTMNILDLETTIELFSDQDFLNEWIEKAKIQFELRKKGEINNGD